MEVRHWQNSPFILFPKTAFCKLVRELMQDCKTDMHITPGAMLAFGEGAQAYIQQFMRYVELLREHGGRKTAVKADFLLANKMLVGRPNELDGY